MTWGKGLVVKALNRLTLHLIPFFGPYFQATLSGTYLDPSHPTALPGPTGSLWPWHSGARFPGLFFFVLVFRVSPP